MLDFIFNFIEKKKVFWILVLLNLIGAVYGFVFYYGSQLIETFNSNPLLLIFVPDSPLVAFILAAAFLSIKFNFKSDLFLFIAFAAAIKNGFWTVSVLSFYPDFYFPINPLLYIVLFAAHIGIFFEAFILLGKIQLERYFIVVSLFFFFANEISDYVFFTHPPLPMDSLTFMYQYTSFLSIAATFVSYYVIEKYRKPILEIFNSNPVK